MDKQTLSVSDLAIMQGLLYAIEPMLELNDRLPLRSLQAFLMVGFDEGHSVVWYASKVGVRPASMSRSLLDITSRNRYKRKGHGLVQQRRNPNNMREVEYSLSVKGRALLTSMLKQIRP